MSRYKINVITLNGNFLTFKVEKYFIEAGDLVTFIDGKTGKQKQFHSSRCEIEEIGDSNGRN